MVAKDCVLAAAISDFDASARGGPKKAAERKVVLAHS
jgi:hypothetical protein